VHQVRTAHRLPLALPVLFPHLCLVGIPPTPPVPLHWSCWAHRTQGLALAFPVTAGALSRVGRWHFFLEALPATFGWLPGPPEVQRLPGLHPLPLCPPHRARRGDLLLASPRALRTSPRTEGPWRRPCPAQAAALRALPEARRVQGVPSALPRWDLPCTPCLPSSLAPLRVWGATRPPSALPALLQAPGRAHGLPCPPLRPTGWACGARAPAASLQQPAGAGGARGIPLVPAGPLRVPSRAGGAQGLLGVSAALLEVPGEPLALGMSGAESRETS